IAGIAEYGFMYHPEMADLTEVVDFMARGIFFADVINTVSEKYAQEILTPEFGEKLDPLLRDRRDRLFGILNGIDYEVMNPATDKYIVQNYDVEHLDKRVQNKLALQQQANLKQDANIPLIGIISRLTDQKGFDILGDVLDHVLDLDLQLIVLGTGDPHYHELFSRIAQAYPGKAAVFLTFNAELAQRIYAGTDMFLMPSRFEPCGLGQMIAMRYGSVPIVRATGGLADTVKDFDPRTGEGNGFSFVRYDRWALFATIVRALENYKYKDTWRRLQVKGMTADFSWNASARKYVDLYYRAIAARGKEIKLEDYGIVRK
ncbi:MAG: glycosyltransferase, partial [Chloroflexi bacterium]|nr:glycosyltransferase [Chloroflexota bacterium]